MKRGSLRRAVALLLSCLLCVSSVFVLSSCFRFSWGEDDDGVASEPYIVDVYTDAAGNVRIKYSDGRETSVGSVSQNDYTVTVEGELGDVSAASAKGLLSSVKITASFTKTVNGGYGGFFPGMGGGSYKNTYSSKGSGVIYSLDSEQGDAFIVTNYHVVYDASSDSGVSEDIKIFLYGAEYESQAIPATYVGGSLFYDIAVLRVEDCARLRGSVYSAVNVSESEVFVGQNAIAVGNPEGMGISTSYGIVSVASEYISMTAADNSGTVTFRVIRVDTAVNSGNSGGGLFNDKGELIGIVNAKVIDDGVENIGYAIPAAVAAAVTDNIIDNCYGKDNTSVLRAILGVSLGITDSYADVDAETGMPVIVECVKISAVDTDGLAAGNLLAGDVLVSATVGERSVAITRQYHVIDLMLYARVGDTVSLTVLRDGATVTVDIPVTENGIVRY